jgi:hypothetical protein
MQGRVRDLALFDLGIDSKLLPAEDFLFPSRLGNSEIPARFVIVNMPVRVERTR